MVWVRYLGGKAINNQPWGHRSYTFNTDSENGRVEKIPLGLWRSLAENFPSEYSIVPEPNILFRMEELERENEALLQEIEVLKRAKKVPAKPSKKGDK